MDNLLYRVGFESFEDGLVISATLALFIWAKVPRFGHPDFDIGEFKIVKSLVKLDIGHLHQSCLVNHSGSTNETKAYLFDCDLVSDQVCLWG